MHDETTIDANTEPTDHIEADDGRLVDPGSKTQPAEGGVEESESGDGGSDEGSSAGAEPR